MEICLLASFSTQHFFEWILKHSFHSSDLQIRDIVVAMITTTAVGALLSLKHRNATSPAITIITALIHEDSAHFFPHTAAYHYGFKVFRSMNARSKSARF